MKQLYIESLIMDTTYKTKYGTSTLRYTENGWKIQYKEIEESSIDINNWEQLLQYAHHNSDGFCEFNSNLRGKYCNVDYRDNFGDRCQKRIYKNDFVSCKLWNTFEIINPSEIRMEQLIKDLSVEEFIEYMKDNGLNL